MTKLYWTLLITLLTTTSSFGQKNSKEELPDTSSNTKIEKLLRETSIIKKVEFVEVEKVKVLEFQIIIITNLKTNLKTKGLYLSNQSGTNYWSGVVKGERHAYLDESEIDELILFLENSDGKWKNDKPVYQTQYVFETLDNLRVMFWTPKNSKSWKFDIKFSNYIYDNTETLGKSKSDEFLDALRQVKSEIKNH